MQTFRRLARRVRLLLGLTPRPSAATARGILRWFALGGATAAMLSVAVGTLAAALGVGARPATVVVVATASVLLVSGRAVSARARSR